MSTSTSVAGNSKQIHDFLVKLHDTPVDTENAAPYLGPIYEYLMSVLPSEKDGRTHWFCHRAELSTVGAATFLLRLFAYDSALVTTWKEKFIACVEACFECNIDLEKVKYESRTTYFGAFDSNTQDQFFASFEQWQLQTIIKNLVDHKFISKTGSEFKPTGKALSQVNPVILYRILSNPIFLADSALMSLITSDPPSAAFPGWPGDPLLPGVLILALNRDSKVREWVRRQTEACRRVPIPSDRCRGPYRLVIEALTGALTTNTSLSSLSSSYNFSDNPEIVWSSFFECLRFIPPELLRCGLDLNADIRRSVIAHLHDTGPEFVSVLRCFVTVIKQLGKKLWEGESVDFPQVVFDSVKDNTSYTTVIRLKSSTQETPWSLAWFGIYLDTISDKAIYSEILAKMADFLCEELQHERFRDVRPNILITATKFLRGQSKDPFRKSVLANVIDIHADSIISAAFGKPEKIGQWEKAQVLCRELVTSTLRSNIDDIKNTTEQLCRFLSELARGKGKDVHKYNDLVPSLSDRSELWKKTFEALQTDDPSSIADVISVVALCSHVDVLHEKTFISSVARTTSPEETALSMHITIGQINTSLAAITQGFSAALTKHANYNTPNAILNLLKRSGVVKSVVKLMISPIENVQTAAQTLVSAIFDSDTRQDAFRELFKHFPDEAMNGLLEFLETFDKHAMSMPEACSLSKSLVRCLTDIIEVFCSATDGLLHSSSFCRPSDASGPASKLPKLWTLMNKANIDIFKRTPSWAASFDNNEMIEWMRDALIFARDMLEQRRVIETAANSIGGENKKARGNLTPIGRKMIDDLQGTLPELARWLRLTDEELLHQSFALLQTLLECFHHYDICPPEESLQRLRRTVEDARKPNSAQSRLDSSRVLKLENALAAFSEDEIEIISITPKAPADDTYKANGIRQKGKVSATDRKPSLQDKKLVQSKLPARSSASKASSSTSKFFSQHDQAKLDNAQSFPSFRRSSVSSMSSFRSASSSTMKTSLSSRATTPPSDDDSDEEESQDNLSSLAKLQTTPKIKKVAPRRQVKAMDLVPTRTAEDRQIEERRRRYEEERRQALRLQPNVSGLYKSILGWDYSSNEPFPSGKRMSLVNVPDTFQDYDHFFKVFEPLLLLECWQQILQSKETPQPSEECRIKSRGYVDSWIDVDIEIPGALRKDWFLTDVDLVLLRNAQMGVIMGKVQSYRSMAAGSQAAIRFFIPSTGVDPGLTINSTWSISKIINLTTVQREYAALVSLQYYDYQSMILRPNLPILNKPTSDLIQQTISKYKVNMPQATAICAAMDTKGFSLIQGPPGTGKTSTICALVSVTIAYRSRVIPIATGSVPMKPKILLCAPSNAAIDEIAKRLRDSSVKVVRVGTEKSVNASVKDITMDYLVKEKLGNIEDKETNNDIALVQQELQTVKKRRQEVLDELQSVRDNTSRVRSLEEENQKLNSKKIILSKKLDHMRDERKSAGRAEDAARRKARVEVLQEADVICSTLTASGHEMLEKLDFDMIIVDEAAQSIELSSLIPLRYRCDRCVMVGDPQQLPPTVISMEASRYHYNQSLFVRLQKHRPESVHLLSIQYRMHPEISRLPSDLFYGGKLMDGPNMANKTFQEWHSHSKFGIYRVYDVSGVEEKAGQSLKNVTECRIAADLYARLTREFPKTDFDYRIGIVSMYKAQVGELRRIFEQRFGRNILGTIDFNTVDGFQGQEKDIIILSCVRAGPGVQSVGFLSDVRRMNVALTRAKSSLFVLGNISTLERSDDNWRKIVKDARDRDLVIKGDTAYFTAPNNALVAKQTPNLNRKQSQAAPLIPPPPADLVTPKSFKPMASPSKSIDSAPQPANESSMIRKEPSERHGVKRKHEDSDAAPSTSSLPKKPPQAKRPKAGPNIFIPKTKKR